MATRNAGFKLHRRACQSDRSTVERRELAKPAATGALEASASIIARCFAAAVVSGPDRYREALGPSTLSMIGRSLIRQGEIVFAIEVRGGRLVLLPGFVVGRDRRRGPPVVDLQAHVGRAVQAHHA